MRSLNAPPAWQLPMQWPQAGIRPGERDSLAAERLLKGALLLCLLALTVFDRFGLRLGGGYSVPPALIATYTLLCLMVIAGAAELNPRGALAYLAVVSVAALSYLVNANFGALQYVSMNSLLLLLVAYAPFALSLRPGAAAPGLWRWVVQKYIALVLLLAVAGIAQFLAQFVFQPAWLFDFTPMIPTPLRGSDGWNTVISTGEWTKSNGFFMREPSMFSLKLGLAIVLELCAMRRKWVVALLAVALLLTYSGSGLLVLALALLFPFGRRSLFQVAAAAALGALVYFTLGDALNLQYTVGRTEEFQSDNSSAACRFVQPGLLVLEQIGAHGWTSLLGHGPGAMTRMQSTYWCEPTHAKIPFEYGLLGVLAFGALVLTALNRSRAPIRARVALGVEWLLLGALLGPETLLAIYIFSAMWPEGTAARALKEATRRPA